MQFWKVTDDGSGILMTFITNIIAEFKLSCVRYLIIKYRLLRNDVSATCCA